MLKWKTNRMRKTYKFWELGQSGNWVLALRHISNDFLKFLTIWKVSAQKVLILSILSISFLVLFIIIYFLMLWFPPDSIYCGTAAITLGVNFSIFSIAINSVTFQFGDVVEICSGVPLSFQSVPMFCFRKTKFRN